MDDLTVEQTTDVPLDELLALYGSVGWTAYTAEPDVLRAAVAGSSFVVTARRGDRLVGLARAVSDGATICYLQDILVRPEEHRTGVGRALVTTFADADGVYVTGQTAVSVDVAQTLDKALPRYLVSWSAWR